MSEITPTVGWWATYCCIEDLARIDTPEELAELLADQEDEDWPRIRFWPTREAALAELDE